MKLRCMILVLAVANVLSCGKQEEEKRLSLTFNTSNALLIPTAMSSCVQMVQASTSGTTPSEDLSDAVFALTAPRLTWTPKNGETAVISYIRISATSNKLVGGSYTYRITEAELANLFSKTVGTPWNLQLALTATEPTTVTRDVLPLCISMRAGGVKLVEGAEDQAFTISAKAEVFGYTIDANKEEAPLKLTTTFKIENPR